MTGGRAYVATTSASYDAVSVLDMDTGSSSRCIRSRSASRVSQSARTVHACSRPGRDGWEAMWRLIDLAYGRDHVDTCCRPRGVEHRRDTDSAPPGSLYASCLHYGDGELVVVDSAGDTSSRPCGSGRLIRDIAPSPDGAVGSCAGPPPAGGRRGGLCRSAAQADRAVVDVERVGHPGSDEPRW